MILQYWYVNKLLIFSFYVVLCEYLTCIQIKLLGGAIQILGGIRKLK